jgi:hypothetical protein
MYIAKFVWTLPAWRENTVYQFSYIHLFLLKMIIAKCPANRAFGYLSIP